ncbi:MAG: AAA family ATPase [Pirellulaceae bacterium]|nr:AAA family ATPase [Pirellulaceae bacterium]
MSDTWNPTSDRPFCAAPDVRLYFPHSSIQAARETSMRALIRAEGPVLVIGGTGLGKSMLAELVADELSYRMDTVRLQASQLCSRRALLQCLLYELQLPYRDLSEGELRLSILDRLEPSPETAPDGILIIADEAHLLHWKLLDELRLLSNYTRKHQPRVRLMLLGSMRLEETLASHHLESFNQRLAARCYLQPMSQAETMEFVRHQLRVAGQEPNSTITHEALQAVHAASQGIPRLANQLMDHAQVMALAQAQSPISVAMIGEAWADLQQLPVQWVDAASSKTPGTIQQDAHVERPSFGSYSAIASTKLSQPAGSIEFGELSDDLADDMDADTGTNNGDLKMAGEERVTFEPWPDSSVELAQPVQATESTPPCESDLSPHPNLSSTDFNYFSAFAAEPLDDPNLAAEKLSCSQPNSSRKCCDSIGACDHSCADNRVAQPERYDAMGVWENDPPLLTPQPTGLAIGDNPITMALQAPGPGPASQPCDLFGSDFEDEAIIPDHGAFVQPTQSANAGTSSARIQQATSDHDYVRRMNAYAETIIQVSQLESEQSPTSGVNREPTSSTKLDGQEALNNLPPDQQNTDASQQILWRYNVAPTSGQAEPIERELAEIVSQMNFSAFQVEPFSVEQIPLDIAEKQRFSNNQSPVQLLPFRASDSTKLTAGSEQSPDHWFASQAYDDDRDLLVVEEEIPSSTRLLSRPTTAQPTTHTTPYSQLFTKLRK